MFEKYSGTNYTPGLKVILACPDVVPAYRKSFLKYQKDFGQAKMTEKYRGYFRGKLD
jgi:hypothetical protein